jgi:cytochrome c oxidase subunit 4
MGHSHSHSHAKAQDHAHDVSKHVKVYILVFVALLVGTAITVGLNYLHFDSVALTVAIALFVATVKAFLVAGFFMHLISEKKAIYAIMLSTVFFFAAMMYLTVWSRGQLPLGSRYLSSPTPGAPAGTIGH